MSERRDLRVADEQWMKEHPDVEAHRPAVLLKWVTLWETRGEVVTHVRLVRGHDVDPQTGRDHQYTSRFFS
jgi:hypothetical protein